MERCAPFEENRSMNAIEDYVCTWKSELISFIVKMDLLFCVALAVMIINHRLFKLHHTFIFPQHSWHLIIPSVLLFTTFSLLISLFTLMYTFRAGLSLGSMGLLYQIERAPTHNLNSLKINTKCSFFAFKCSAILYI